MQEVRRVLVVEDDESLRDGVRAVLERAGYPVLAVATAAEAISLIRSAPLAAVLSDVHLSEGSGFDVADCARRVAPALPVALMSAMRAEDLGVVLGSTSVRLFLHKPVATSEIVAAVDRLIRGDEEPPAPQ